MLPRQRELRERVRRAIERFGCGHGEFRYDDEQLRAELAAEGIALAFPTLYVYVRQYCPGRYIAGRCIPDPERCAQVGREVEAEA